VEISELANPKVNREDVLRANVYIHTAVIDLYKDQPHFRPENKAKVTEILAGLRQSIEPIVSGKSKLLDMACGTGFMINLAEPFFDELHGVDITPAMLEQVDLSSGKISLHTGVVEQTPYADASFDMVTAYSFMDHLYELKPFLKEVYRVLKPRGLFYSDQNANRAFWERVSDLHDPLTTYSPIVQREMTAGLHAEEELAKQRDIDLEACRIAEFIKTQENGIDASEVLSLAKEIGFRDCVASYDWFLGQGKVMHGQSLADAAIVETYLHEVAPLSDHLFKYLRFDFIK
jgi:ubiquinone/menaquinone biosynthesis C-methylase UbiE